MPTQVRDSKGRFASGNGRPTLNQRDFAVLAELISNATFSRARMARAMMDPRRDIDDECGFPQTEELTPRIYQEMYDREAIATRVVEVLPQESWAVQPTVYESEDTGHVTPFEATWDEVAQNLRSQSWFHGEQGSPIWEHLHRADRLSGIGRFGVLLLGLDDGKPLSEPVDGIDEQGNKSGNPEGRQLLYLRSFDESLVSIVQSVTDQTNPRYGWPTAYSVTLGTSGNTQVVHWSRVIHIADNLGNSEVFGTPRMQPVYNNLYNLRKIYGSDAEAFWYNVVGDLFFEATDPGTRVNEGDFRDMMEKLKSGLQRWGYLGNVKPTRLAPTVVDPTAHIDAQITAICIRLGIPKRIFMGSERGNLASAQDDSTWNRRLAHRQNNHITPRLIVPLIDRLILAGVLPEPEQYSVVWPDLDSLTEDEKATIAQKRTDALVKYVQGGVEALIPPLEYLTRIQSMPGDEAESMVEAAMEQIETEDRSKSPLLGLVGGVTGMAELFGKHGEGAISRESLKEIIKLFYQVDDEQAERIISDESPEGSQV